MSTLNRLSSKLSQVLQPEPLPQQVLTLSPEELKDHFQKTSEIINSTVFVLVGFCFFCALALSGPDAKLLSADPSIDLPFVQSRVSFQVFLIVAPLTLAVLLLYVHIYVGHWWHLLRVERQQSLHAGIDVPPMWQPPLIFNLPTRLASLTSILVLYLIGPLTLLFFCYEALKVPQTPSSRFGLIGFLSSLIKGPRHALSPASCVIPLSMAAIILFGFLVGRRVIEPHANEWKWTEGIYRLSLAVVTLCASTVAVIALFFPGVLPKFPLNLTNADLQSHNLSSLDLSGAMLWNANLQHANLNDSRLDGAYLVSADLSGATVKLASVKGTQLLGADLSGTDFADSNLTGANLCATNLARAEFDGATLADVNWKYADLGSTTLAEAGLTDLKSIQSAEAPCFKDNGVAAGRKCCGTDCFWMCY
jgi:Pentapeptide repeats (8 copies)